MPGPDESPLARLRWRQHGARPARRLILPPWVRRGSHGRMLRAARELGLGFSHTAFVTAAFRGLLGRDPDADGLAHYVGDLRAGRTTREQSLTHIGNSAEAVHVVLQGPGLREYVRELAALRAEVPASARPICFLHLMKSGGTAFTDGLSAMAHPWPRLIDVWVDQLACLPVALLHQTMLVTGHLPYEALRLLPPETAACTVLRDPVARTLSHFVHLRTHDGMVDLTLEDFVLSAHRRPRWLDYQARQLMQPLPVEDARLGRFPDPSLQHLLDHGPVPVDLEAYAAAALARLDTIELVGVTDRLDSLLGRVAAFWGKPSPAPLQRTNVSEQPLRREDVPDRLLAEIARGTTVDAALYERAMERERGTM